MDILDANRKYDCYCGTETAFEFAASYILEHSNSDGGIDFKVAVVSDRIVSGYYYNKFENQFILRGVKPVLIPVECNDSGKNLTAVDSIYKYLTDFNFGSGDWIIALGGGGIIDATGFAASIFDGGINYIAVPTTLGSMCDTCIASRAKLNSGSHKNEISAVVNPNAVIVDPSFIKTVPDKIKHNGYAYIIRLALLDNVSLINDLVNLDNVNIREFLNAVYASRTSVEKKNPLLLTLGDEVAQAIESYFRFMNYSDGEALALSLLSVMDSSRRAALFKIYDKLGLPTRLEGVSGKTIIKALEDRIKLRCSGKMPVVMYESEGGGRWVIRMLDKPQALDVFKKRISAISDVENT